jgi:hypothetical protein
MPWESPLRCGSLRSPPLRSAPAPVPETTPREFLFILILLFLALLINYDHWKCLRDIGMEGCDQALVILSYTIRVAVNLEGDYGKSNQCASAASCGAARSAVAPREVRPSDFRDRVAKWFRNLPDRKPSNPNYLGSFTTENGEVAKGEMGEGSEGT